ncbi:MAG: alpha-1,4-glucan--maltose-1-phosphate maltosyltransferase [Proteobacteria bacterium]|nr:MAG: alpha-1,4-glucan--maltose-1-phosphate maltosyltransferase [Pseudomonadota bacterium]
MTYHSPTNPELKLAPSRVIIDRIQPEIDGGRFAAKRYLDQPVTIQATLLTDGHDKVKGRLLYRHESEKTFTTVTMTTKWNDEWSASFQPKQLGRYYFKIEAALDRFGHWRTDLFKKQADNQNLSLDFRIGAELLLSIADESKSKSASLLKQAAAQLESWSKLKTGAPAQELARVLNDPALELMAYEVFDQLSTVSMDREIPIQVEPVLARFSSWYEFFPRSTVWKPNSSLHHGTLKEAAERLNYVRDMGFNIVYLPPIHPVGTAYRKGKNNTLTPEASDVGSPWAIGAKEGGHKSVHPDLGTLKDFAALVERARSLKIEIAMDIAFQCSPDHPYVKDHPDWFKKRPDGTIQYAENPPKKYQDIYPFDFESKDWKAMWTELRDVLQFWVDQGVRVFRVDNPHTKAFHFWEWAIAEIKAKTPDVLFLAEAFTRPHIMAYLAKIGFTQSYTYFTWRNVKWELEQYMTELTKTDLKDVFSPNFWPNTPDINPEPLHVSDRAIYLQRLILAATLSSNYGIYGPVYELMVSAPKGKEEYLDSEKYELKQWKLDDPSKNSQSGMVALPLADWKIDGSETFEVYDLLTDTRYYWTGWQNYVELDPQRWPAHIFKISRNPKALQGAKV